MLNNESQLGGQQSPRREALDRTLEQLPAFFLPRLIATDNLNKMQHDARMRTRDSHRLEMKMLGVKEMADDEPPDISVSGDNYNYHQPKASPLPWLATAIGGAGLAAAALLYSQQPRNTTPPTSQPVTHQHSDADTNTKYTIKAMPGR